MLTLNNLTLEQGKRILIKNFGLTLGLGSGLIITGPNGSGKSTLLRTIAGFHSPKSGKILWNNEDVKTLGGDFYGDINYLGHKNYFKAELTVEENINYWAQIANTEILIPAAIHHLQIGDLLEKKFGNLSKGQQQKVMLSKLLFCPSTIWLLDEPDNNLDLENKKLLFNLVSNRIKDGGMVIMATHDEMFLPLGARVLLKH